jgi:hypothetical protein
MGHLDDNLMQNVNNAITVSFGLGSAIDYTENTVAGDNSVVV